MRTVPQNPDVVEAGRVLATLDDWRAIVFILAFIIVVLIIERGWAGWSMRKERQDMWMVANKFGDASDKLTVVMNDVKTELAVLRYVSSRVESTSTTNGEG